MWTRLILLVALSLQLFLGVNSRGAGECAMLCNDLRFEVLTLEICREAKRTLPRPKVGDFCTTAMEQGFSDACVALCMEQQPVGRVAQTCRAAAIEMPRPTVRRWCEHGYNTAFQKTLNDLRYHFTDKSASSSASSSATTSTATASSVPANGGFVKESVPPVYENNQPAAEAAGHQETATHTRRVLTTVPVTLENDETRNLQVYEGQDAEEAVVEFCREHLPSEVATCIRHLLDIVVEKLAEVKRE